MIFLILEVEVMPLYPIKDVSVGEMDVMGDPSIDDEDLYHS